MDKVLIFGAGITGLGAKELLDYVKIPNILIDDKIGIKSSYIYEIELSEIKYVVKSPGISWENEYLKYLKDNNVKIISEIELGYEYMPKDIKLIAITGTNGKTTTTVKTYELLKFGGKNVRMAGNVGISYSKVVKEILEKEEKVEYIVLELSSYQLENNDKIPFYISLITNLTPDHLARYIDVDDYYNTKFNIFKGQLQNSFSIINLDDEEINKRSNLFNEKTIKRYISRKNIEDENALCYFENKIELENKVLKTNRFTLKGMHNIENLLFVITIAKICKIDEDKIEEFLYSTKTLEHRMENFFEYKGVVFINDSKGTNVESTLKAISSYDNDLYLILGGEDKKIDNTELVKSIEKKVKKVYLIGTNFRIFEELFNKYNYSNYEYLENIQNVAKRIKEEIENKEILENSTILFSPATSSFDQFLNFEDRGTKFKEVIIHEFKGE